MYIAGRSRIASIPSSTRMLAPVYSASAEPSCPLPSRPLPAAGTSATPRRRSSSPAASAPSSVLLSSIIEKLPRSVSGIAGGERRIGGGPGWSLARPSRLALPGHLIPALCLRPDRLECPLWADPVARLRRRRDRDE